MVNLFHGYHPSNHPNFKNVLFCKRLHARLWNCSVVHTSRCSNLCADVVTKLGYSLNPLDVMYFWFETPSVVLNIVMRKTVVM